MRWRSRVAIPTFEPIGLKAARNFADQPSTPKPVTPKYPSLPGIAFGLKIITLSSLFQSIGQHHVAIIRRTITSAELARSKAISIPMDSIVIIRISNTSRIQQRHGNPDKSMRTSITSRVVPAISDVIAALPPSQSI